MNILGIELVQTCSACPEQYDAYKDGVEVGYFRLRHGCFTVDCLDTQVYVAYPKGDGIFYEEERYTYLLNGVCRILDHLKEVNI